MRRIEETSRFRRDFKREKKGANGARLDAALRDALILLADDVPLPAKYRDHPLSGVWNGNRDCHIRPDLVLIYAKPSADIMRLVRLGSHGDLGL